MVVIRLVAWSGLLAVLAVMDGLSWLSTPVSVPLWGILVMTILPAESIGTLAQTIVERLQKRAEG